MPGAGSSVSDRSTVKNDAILRPILFPIVVSHGVGLAGSWGRPVFRVGYPYASVKRRHLPTCKTDEKQ